MSIDNLFERGVSALESIAKSLEVLAANSGQVTVTNETAPTKPASTRKATATTTKKVEEPVIEGEASEVVETKEETAKIKHEETPPTTAKDPLDEGDDAPKITKEDIRTALKNFRDIEGSAAMMEVLKNHGAAGIGDLTEDQYASVMAAVK